MNTNIFFTGFFKVAKLASDGFFKLAKLMVFGVVVGLTPALVLPTPQALAQTGVLELWADGDGVSYNGQATISETKTPTFGTADHRIGFEFSPSPAANPQVRLQVETKGAFIAADSGIIANSNLTHALANADGTDEILYNFSSRGSSLSIGINLENDGVIEDDGYIVITVLAPDNSIAAQNYTLTSNMSRRSVTINITSDDQQSTIGIAPGQLTDVNAVTANATYAESATAYFTIFNNPASPVIGTGAVVNLQVDTTNGSFIAATNEFGTNGNWTSGGGAVQNVAYRVQSSGPFIQVPIALDDDAIAEADGSIVVTLMPSTDGTYNITSATSALLAITSEDIAPEFRVFWGDRESTLVSQDKQENPPSVSAHQDLWFRTSDNATISSDITLNVRITQPDGNALGSPRDNGAWLDNANGFIRTGRTATRPFDFPNIAASTDETSTVVVTSGHSGAVIGINHGDVIDDPRLQRVIVELLPGTGYTVSSTHGTATLNIYDDDVEIDVTLVDAEILYAEPINVRATGPAGRAQRHDVTFAVTGTETSFIGSPATVMIDLPNGNAVGSLEIGTDRNTSAVTGIQTITLTAQDNLTDGYRFNPAGQAKTLTSTIYPPPVLSASDATAMEGANAEVTFSLSHVYLEDVVVGYETMTGTATAADYTGTSTGSATIVAGDTNVNVTIALAVDSLSESDEEFTVVGTPAIPQITNALMQTKESRNGAAATGTVTITDNSDDPIISISGPASGVVRPGENATFTINNVGNVATGSLGVRLEIDGASGGVFYTSPSDVTPSAISGNDTAATVTILGSATSEMLLVTAPMGTDLDDIVVEVLAETGYTRQTANNAHIARARVFSVEAGFTDGAGTAISTARVGEGESVTLNVTLDPPQATAVTLDYATANGVGAVAGENYVGDTGTVLFAAGETEATITIATIDNNVHEGVTIPNFAVNLSGTIDGEAIMSSVAVSIIDDDELPLLSLAGPGRIAPGENGTFTIRSARTVFATDTPVSVDVEGNASRVYYTAPFATAETEVEVGASGVKILNIGLPEGQQSVEFIVEADEAAADGSELMPIIVSLNSDIGYAVSQTATANSTNTSVRSVGLSPLAVNEAILPQAVVAVLDEVGGAIADRTHRSFGDTETAGTRRGSFTIEGESVGGFALGLAGREAAREAAENPWDAVDAAGRVSLLEDISLHDLAFSLPLQAGEGRGGVSVWGAGFLRNVDGATAGVAFDGEVPGAMLGVDARVSDNLLAGIGFASSTADFEYEVVRGADVLKGSHETELTLYSPYVGYRTEGGANVWASLGVGEGEVTLTPAGDAGGEVYVGEIEVLSYGAGFNSLSEAQRDAVGGESVAWNWHGDVQWAMVEETPTARTRGAYAGAGAAGAELSVGRARLGAEISQVQDLDGGGLFRRSIDLAVRHDSGDTAEGGALEIGGSLGLDLVSGIKLDLTARTLVFHEESVDDWGVSGGFNWVSQPGAGGRGLTLALSPEWGNSVSAGDGLLADGVGVATGLAGVGGDAGAGAGAVVARYGFDVRYGIPLLRDGLLVPYVSGDAGDVGASAVYGGAYSLGGFAAGVEAEAGDADAGNAFIRYEREF